jgi:hypothetical protein
MSSCRCLLRATASLDRSAVLFMAGVNERIECFYMILNFLLDTFVPVRRVTLVRSDDVGVDEIPLSFVKLFLPVLTHIFVSSKLPERWKTSSVLLIRKIGIIAKFSDYRPISLLVCLSKVFEVLMARQIGEAVVKFHTPFYGVL